MKHLRYIILILLYWLSLPIALAADDISDLVAIDENYTWIVPDSLSTGTGFIDSPTNRLWGKSLNTKSSSSNPVTYNEITYTSIVR